MADLARLRTHVCLDSLRVHFAICLRRRALPPAPRAGSARRGRTHSCTDNPSQGPRAPAARSPEPAPRSSAAASAPFHTLPLQTPSPEGLARISHHPLGGWIIGCELVELTRDEGLSDADLARLRTHVFSILQSVDGGLSLRPRAQVPPVGNHVGPRATCTLTRAPRSSAAASGRCLCKRRPPLVRGAFWHRSIWLGSARTFASFARLDVCLTPARSFCNLS